MVSMAPNSQLYDLSYKYKASPFCKPAPRLVEQDMGTIYDVLKRYKNFTKTVKLIDIGDTGYLYSRLFVDRSEVQHGITLFVTDDSKIPQEFVEFSDKMAAGVFLKSYTVAGVADIDYLVKNGTSVYKTRNNDNPILCNVRNIGKEVEITINRIGRVVREIKTTNGNIIVLDNIANVGNVN